MSKEPAKEEEENEKKFKGCRVVKMGCEEEEELFLTYVWMKLVEWASVGRPNVGNGKSY